MAKTENSDLRRSAEYSRSSRGPMATWVSILGAMLKLVKDPSRRREMGERARQLVREPFSLSQIAQAMELVYCEPLPTSTKRYVRPKKVKLG